MLTSVTYFLMKCIGLGQHPIVMQRTPFAQHERNPTDLDAADIYCAPNPWSHTRTLHGFNLLNAKPLSERTCLMRDYQLRAFVKLTRIIMSVLVGLILQPWWSDFQRRLLHEFNQNKPWKITTESEKRPIWAAFIELTRPRRALFHRTAI